MLLINDYLVSEWAQKKKSHLAVIGSWVIQFIMVFNLAAISSIPSTWHVMSHENSCFPSLLHELFLITNTLPYLNPFLAISSKYFCSFTRLNSDSSRISKDKLISESAIRLTTLPVFLFFFQKLFYLIKIISIKFSK